MADDNFLIESDIEDDDDEETIGEDVASFVPTVSAIRSSPRRHASSVVATHASPRRNAPAAARTKAAVVAATAAVASAAAAPTAAAGAKRKATATVPPAKRRVPITKARGFNYTDDEMVFLLESIRATLPIGRVGWEKVEALHKEHATYGLRGRTHQLLRAKFMRLVNMKKPSGDADIPDDVAEAKNIMTLLNQKSDAGVDVDDCELGASDAEEEAAEDDRSAAPTAAADNRVAVAPRRLLTTPRRTVQSAASSQDQLMQLMVLQQSERIAMAARQTEPAVDNTAVQLLLMQVQTQQRLLEKISDRLDKMDKDK
jgi:hypothetical protein